jgi:hypothetical protein
MNNQQLLESSTIPKTVRADSEVIFAELGDETSLLNVKTGIYFTLNAVGSSVWRQIQQTRTVDQVKDQLLKEYDVDEERCRGDLVRLIEELRRNGLIQVNAA